MKNKICLFINLVLVFFLTSSIFPKENKETISAQIDFLIQEHFKSLEEFNHSGLDPFEKIFFRDSSILNLDETKNFFHSIKADLDSGKHRPGISMISFQSYSNINGKVTGVSYEYKSDGKKIILTKGTLHNGKLLKANYEYDVEQKKLDTYEVKNSKILQKKSYSLEV
jgi:hypothetical protein